MKNILRTEKDLELFNKEGKRVYWFRKNSDGYSWEATYDSNGNQLTFKDSDGYSWETTYDSNGNQLTYKNSEWI
jgi:YD repeat-containing protein